MSSALKNRVIWGFHSSAHLGISKFLHRLRIDWYWPGMTRNVKRRIRLCEPCQVAKKGRLQPARGTRHLFAGRNCSARRHGPNNNYRSRRESILLLGIPEVIHTDQEAQFESKLMKDQCRLLGVAHTHTTPYHPQANGMVEKENRVLGDSLRTLLLDKKQTDWDKVLP